MLNNKAKGKFEEWYLKLPYHYPALKMDVERKLVGFENLPLSLKWGVYLEFADSLGYYIDIQPCPCCFPRTWTVNITWEDDKDRHDEDYGKDWIQGEGQFTLRKEAQIEAIKHLNNLINKE